MKKNAFNLLVTIAIFVIMIVVSTGCYERRYYRGHQDHSVRYNHRHLGNDHHRWHHH